MPILESSVYPGQTYLNLTIEQEAIQGEQIEVHHMTFSLALLPTLRQTSMSVKRSCLNGPTRACGWGRKQDAKMIYFTRLKMCSKEKSAKDRVTFYDKIRFLTTRSDWSMKAPKFCRHVSCVTYKLPHHVEARAANRPRQSKSRKNVAMQPSPTCLSREE